MSVTAELAQVKRCNGNLILKFHHITRTLGEFMPHCDDAEGMQKFGWALINQKRYNLCIGMCCVQYPTAK